MSLDETELQRWMARQLRSRRELTSQTEVVRIAADHFRSDLRLQPAEQLEVYRRQFWLRHTEALLEDFPALAALLGQTRWEQLAETYLEHTPLADCSLRDLGAGLPACVAAQDWLPERELAADLARFEWALVEAFDAADADPIAPSVVAALDERLWASARLDLHPSLRLLDLRYPVPALVARAKAGEPLPDSVAPAACRVAVYRSGLKLAHEPLSAAGLSVLEALRSGTGLVAACEQAVTQGLVAADDLAADLADWFERWARLGWIVGVRSA